MRSEPIRGSRPMWEIAGRILGVLPGSGWKEAVRRPEGNYRTSPILAWLVWEHQDEEGETVREFVPVTLGADGRIETVKVEGDVETMIMADEEHRQLLAWAHPTSGDPLSGLWHHPSQSRVSPDSTALASSGVSASRARIPSSQPARALVTPRPCRGRRKPTHESICACGE